MTSMSVHDYRKLYPGRIKEKASSNKFNAQKVELEGMTFDSKKEFKRYVELKARQQRGEIADLKHHTKFELAPKVKIVGEKRAKPALRYFADFTYFEIVQKKALYVVSNFLQEESNIADHHAVYVVEDVKSMATRKLASYRNKKHLMKSVFDIDVKEI
ncbi:hypothetical protein F889_01560 [Acinetobacter colistiniresistens]|uniref:DUF1064 domain-containing protein n=1 Tax=Acinetobacter colistiniresistens TaxID=280145 RepID=N9R8F8_9GAMM|nr:DUF1064 domain-containing protein [Acinetobacter colistiniresistens]ENX34920.1 hypothetical protein F889_01560 [Acinetobacter colistiniresistens]